MLPFPFNLSHCMTEKELVYFVHCASHRLCINNRSYHSSSTRQVCHGSSEQGSSSSRPERRLQLPSHVSLPSISHHLSSKGTEVFCRTAHLQQAPQDWSTGLSRRHCPHFKHHWTMSPPAFSPAIPHICSWSHPGYFAFFSLERCVAILLEYLTEGVGAQGDVLILFVPLIRGK